MIVRDTKIFTFDSCHHLPFHQGKCKNLHGHTYTLEVTIEGSLVKEETPEYGMITDFANLKEIVKRRVIDIYDHQDLNKFFPNPTSEIMAKVIFHDLVSEFNADGVPYTLHSIKLWETPTSYTEVLEG